MRIFAGNSNMWLAVLCTVAMASTAIAQPKKKGPPPTTREKLAARTLQTLDLANAAWVDAMEELGDPYLLFAFGIDDGSAERAMGLNLSSDELAFTEGLATQIRAYMLDAYIDTEILDFAELRAIQARNAADMRDAGLAGAIDQMLREVDADLGIICQFTPQPDGSYRTNAKIVDPRSGHRFDTGSYTIDPEGHNVDTIAAALFEEIANRTKQIAHRKSPKYNVLIIGDIGGKEFRGLPRFVSEIEYVKSSSRSIRPRLGADQYSLRGIRYDGFPLDLGYEISDLLAREYDVRSRVTFSDGSIAIRVFENAEPPAWHLLTSEKANPKKEMFEALYRERGAPRVAVLINQAPAGTGARGVDASNLIMHGAVLATSLPEATQAIENEIAGMMSNAGVDVVDGGRLRDQVIPSGQSAGSPLREGQLLEELRDLGGFDVLVLGQASPTSGGLPSVTFRMMMVENGRVLGTRSWPSRDAVSDPDYRVETENADPQRVSRFLAGGILDMFMRNHLMKGMSIDIRVDGVSSYRQAGFIASSVESVVPGVLSATNVRLSGDVANFTIRYSGDQESLLVALQESISSLPIETKIDQAGTGVIRLRAVPLDSGE